MVQRECPAPEILAAEGVEPEGVQALREHAIGVLPNDIVRLG